MKLVSFVLDGIPNFGILEGTQVLAASEALHKRFADLKSLLAEGNPNAIREGAAKVDFARVKLLPPIPNPAKIFCIGRNYEDHRVETGGAKLEKPTIFTRFADTQVAHGDNAWVPSNSSNVDFEAELAVIIGRPARHVSKEKALDYVAGYSCYNDISIRDWQNHTTQFTPGKNFPQTGGFGPWIVTADEITDPQTLSIAARLNGQTVQESNTDHMIFTVAECIEYCSAFTTLYPGDVIATGTPGGVGAKRKPPLWMKDGDVIEVEIGSVGLLSLKMVPEPR